MTSNRGPRTVWASLGLLAVTVAATSCEQEPIHCQVARSPFAARLILEQRTGVAACDNKTAEIFGLHTYYHPRSNGRPDFDRARLAIQPEVIRARQEVGGQDPNPAHSSFSLGDFETAHPDSDALCGVSSLSVTEQRFTDLPPLYLTYEWSNFRVLVSAAHTGSQFAADLTYTDKLQGCTAQYEVWGVSHSSSDAECPEASCDPLDPRFGINPDFPLECAAEIKQCVLTKAPPAFK